MGLIFAVNDDDGDSIIVFLSVCRCGTTFQYSFSQDKVFRENETCSVCEISIEVRDQTLRYRISKS
jgi:hypothetical protein